MNTLFSFVVQSSQNKEFQSAASGDDEKDYEQERRPELLQRILLYGWIANKVDSVMAALAFSYVSQAVLLLQDRCGGDWHPLHPRKAGYHLRGREDHDGQQLAGEGARARRT